jgi:hypothetical protein
MSKAWHDQLAAELPLATEILVRPVKNRGRDGMPWLCAFRDEILRQGEPARPGQQRRNLREAVFGHHQRCARGAVPGLSGEFVLLGTHAVSAAVVALNLTDADFPEEMSQSDGTLAHAVERIIGLLDKPTGMVKQCVTVTPPLTLDDLAGMGNG